MEFRPDYKELWWSNFTGVELAMVLMVVFVVLLVFAALIYALEPLWAAKEKEKERFYNTNAFWFLILSLPLLFGLQSVTLGYWAEHSSTTQKEEFFNNPENREWYTENFTTIYEKVEKETYNVLEVKRISKIDDAREFTEFGKILYGGKEKTEEMEMTTKQRSVYDQLKEKSPQQEMLFAEIIIKNEKDEVKNVGAFVVISINERYPYERAVLFNTGQIKGDPGTDVFYGELELVKNIFKNE